MGCSKDSGCLTIAQSTYPSLQGEINSNISKISNSINEITSGLMSLAIPDDYLDDKVKSRVNAICSNLNSDETEIGSVGSNINGFVSNKIVEHMKHYKEWQRQQELARQRRLRALRENEGEGTEASEPTFSRFVNRDERA